MQVSAVVVDPPDQTQLASMAHVLLHPSPLLELLSSHCSDPNLIPSPQSKTHAVGLETSSTVYPVSQLDKTV